MCGRIGRRSVIAALALSLIVSAHAFGLQRTEICLNGRWLFHGGGDEKVIPQENWVLNEVPGLFAHRYTSDLQYYGHFAWYKTGLVVPKQWSDGRRVFVRFVSVNGYAHVYVNGKSMGTNTGHCAPFEFDVTDAARFGAANELAVYVDDYSRFGKRRVAPGSDFTKGPGPRMGSGHRGKGSKAGIPGDVFLVCRPVVRVDDVFVMTSVRKKTITVRTWLRNDTKGAVTLTLSQRVLDGENTVKTFPEKTVQIPAGKTIRVETSLPWKQPKMWGYGEYGSPLLYRLASSIRNPNSKMDNTSVRFGFRELWPEGTKLLFNGKPIFLMGDSDSVSSAMPVAHNRHYINQSLIARRKANINIIRLGWDARLPNWFGVADQAGMLLEVSVCGSLPQGPLKEAIEEQISGYVRAYRNHPSIVLWESNNEAGSWDINPKMMKGLGRIHDLCKQEDPTRLVHPQGSPMVGRAPDYGIEYQPDIWDVHPYGSPVMSQVRDKMKRGGYDGKRPWMLGEMSGLDTRIGWGLPGHSAKQRKTAWDAYYEPWGKYWADSMGEIYKEGCVGYMLLTLACRGWIGPTGPDSYDGGPWNCMVKNTVREFEITWPSRSGPDIKARGKHRPGALYNNLNWWDPTRKVCGWNICSEQVKCAYAKLFGGDMPALNEKRRPEVIVTVKAKGQPVPDRYVLMQPVSPISGEPIGVKTDENGTAWFVLPEAGRYQMSLLHEQGEIAGPVVEMPWAKREFKAGYDFIRRFDFMADQLAALGPLNKPDISRAKWLEAEAKRATAQRKKDTAQERQIGLKAKAEGKKHRYGRTTPKSAYTLYPVAGQMVIDGKDDEWKNYPAIEIGFPEQFTGHKRNARAKSIWWGRADCSGRIKLAWASDALYFFAWVRDDNARQARTLDGPSFEDGIEIYFGPKGPVSEYVSHSHGNKKDRKDFQLVFGAGSRNVAPRFLLAYTPVGLHPKAEFIVSPRDDASGYIIEGCIDVKSLGDFKLESGREVGLNVAINDVDQRDGTVVRKKLDWACDAYDKSCSFAFIWNKAMLYANPPEAGDANFKIDYPVTLVPGIKPQVTVRVDQFGRSRFNISGKPIIRSSGVAFCAYQPKTVVTGHGYAHWSPRMQLEETDKQITLTLRAGPPKILTYEQTLKLSDRMADMNVAWKLVCHPKDVPDVKAKYPDGLGVAADFVFRWAEINVVGRTATLSSKGTSQTITMPVEKSILLGKKPAEMVLPYDGGKVRLKFSTDTAWPRALVRSTDFCVPIGYYCVRQNQGSRFRFTFVAEGNPEIVTAADTMPPLATRQLTTDGGREPTWSPCGRWIAYAADQDGKPAIWKVNPVARSKPVVLCADGEMPVWSRNGKHIAFVRRTGPRGVVMIMKSDGSGVRQLTSDRAEDSRPTWWGNDKLICETHVGVGIRTGLSSLSIKDGKRTWLPYDGATYPVVRPKSDRIAYVKSDEVNKMCIYMERLPGQSKKHYGRDLVQITRSGGADGGAFSPDFLADGRTVFVEMPMQPSSDIYTCLVKLRAHGRNRICVAPKAEDIRRLTEDRAGNETPRWSPDGKVIAFSKRTPKGTRQLFLLRLGDE